MSKLFLRKIIAFLSIFFGAGAFLGIIFGISSHYNSSTTGKVADIALLLSTKNNPFFSAVEKGLRDKANQLNLTVETYDSNNNTSIEDNNVANIIAKKHPIVVFNDVNEDSGIGATRKFNQAKLPVIALDHILVGEKVEKSGIEVLANIASDNVQAGKIIAQFLAQKIKLPQEILTYILYGIPGTESGMSRTKGFIEPVKNTENQNVQYNVYGYTSIGEREKYGKTYLFDQANDNRTEATNKTNARISQNFADNVKDFRPNLIFGTNDEAALGAIASIQNNQLSNILAGNQIYSEENKHKVWVTGIDYTKDAIDAILKHKTMTATVEQETAVLGALAALVVKKYFDGTFNDSTLKQYKDEFPQITNELTIDDQKITKGYYFQIATKLFWAGEDGNGEKLISNADGQLVKVE